MTGGHAAQEPLAVDVALAWLDRTTRPGTALGSFGGDRLRQGRAKQVNPSGDEKQGNAGAGATQSAHRGGCVDPPWAAAARAAHPAAGAGGPTGKHACLSVRGSAGAPLAGYGKIKRQ
jgi:hypothetical protein